MIKVNETNKRPIYLDYNATTPIDPIVLETMLPFLRDAFGNSSSMTHAYGWEANQAVEKAREQAGDLVSAPPKSITWTSGATESNNLALLSTIRFYLERDEKPHFITTQMEHKSVLDVAQQLENEGAEVTFIKPDQYGQILPDKIQAAIRPNTRLISVIMGQNEVGTINPIAEIGKIARERKIMFHVDAAQALGKTPIDVDKMNIDLLSASGHKIYAAKGIGLLYSRKGIELSPLFFGGKQESGLRPGTLNVPAIVALGKACEICSQKMREEVPRLCKMRDEFIARVLNALPNKVQLNGHPSERLYSNVSFSFPNLSADIFALGLSGLALSSGSACSAGAPSHILMALGLPDDIARATLRIGIGRMTTPEELEIAANKIVAMVHAQ